MAVEIRQLRQLTKTIFGTVEHMNPRHKPPLTDDEIADGSLIGVVIILAFAVGLGFGIGILSGHAIWG